MRTLFLALATSATVFASSVTEIAAGDDRYCIQGEYLSGSATIVASPVTSNVRPHRLLRSQSSISECCPNRSDAPTLSLNGNG
jgi:hypothetical protein